MPGFQQRIPANLVDLYLLETRQARRQAQKPRTLFSKSKKTEEAYAEQVRERSERQLRRRARELGYELKPVDAPVPA